MSTVERPANAAMLHPCTQRTEITIVTEVKQVQNVLYAIRRNLIFMDGILERVTEAPQQEIARLG